MTDVLDDLTPLDIGLPGKYKEWRPIQKQAIEFSLESKRRFIAPALPTGSGKTLYVMTLSQIWSDKRFAICTSTKGLQDQYASAFNPDPLLAAALTKLGQPVENLVADVRGRSNYHCENLGGSYTCEEGPKLGCIYHNTPNCGYTSDVTHGQMSKVAVTNYKWWMGANKSSGNALVHQLTPDDRIDVLVLDEAHLAPTELADFLSTRITQTEITDILGVTAPLSENMNDWCMFARNWRPDLQNEIKYLNDYIRRSIIGGQRIGFSVLRKLKSTEALLEKFDKLVRASDNWVCEQKDGTRVGRVWTFDPIWPGAYAESCLFFNIPKVILLSATVRPKTLSLLSVRGHDVDFKEWDRVFPSSRSPIYHIPTVKLSRKSTDADYVKWLDTIDRIIESRIDRKGLIHTGSYERQKRILEGSAYAHLMFANTDDPSSPNAAVIYQSFLNAPAPAILVSPSFGTGWDFPGETAEWQIIAKIPFANHTTKIMRARSQRDRQYLGYVAMQELVQAIGRPMRSDTDRGETFIIDDHINYFMFLNKSLAPRWFAKQGSIHTVAKIPKPPTPLCEDQLYITAS